MNDTSLLNNILNHFIFNKKNMSQIIIFDRNNSLLLFLWFFLMMKEITKLLFTTD